jgi:penicillin-binding protein 2A
MPNRLVYLAAAAIAMAGAIGCDRTDLSSGDGHRVQPAGGVGGGSDYHPPNNQPGTGNGNAPTAAGSGATNGVIGNETVNWVTGPGNTESGRGTTTRPSSQAPGTTVAPPDSGSTGGGGGHASPTNGPEGSGGG